MKVEAEYRKLKLSVESWKWVQKVEINHSNTWRSLYNDGNVAWDTVAFNKGEARASDAEDCGWRSKIILAALF